MKRLYIVRHGIAVPHGSPEIPDDERPLTPRGERRVRQIGYGLKHLGVQLDLILSSPLPRAFRTAEILSRVLGNPDLLETDDALKASQSVLEIGGWLASRTEESLMIVGHNPSLSELIGLLVTGDSRISICELRRGGIAALTTSNSDPLKWSIDWIARPRLIRRLSAR